MNGMERRGRGAHFLRASGPAFFVCRLRLRGFCDSFSLCLSFLRFLENFIFSLRRAYPFGALRRPQALAFLLGAFVIPLPFLKILLFPFDALGPRGGPYFLLLQKVGKDRRKGVSPPCESPDQSGVLDAPLWKPPSLAPLSGLAELLAASRLELRCRWGRPRARARSPRPPHLHRFGFGGFAPWPPTFPVGERLPVMRTCWGFRPLAPAFPKGKSPPIMRAAHGTAFDKACGQRLRKSPGSSCREAARSSVTPLARLWPQATLARPPGGIPKGAQPSLASLCLLSAGQKVGAPARPERVEGINQKFKKGKGIKKALGKKNDACEARRREKL